MAYERTVWKNREVEYPRRFIITDNGDGTVTIEPSPGNIIEPGTPIIAENMNNIEEGIVLSLSQIGDINDDTLPDDLRGKPLTEQILYVLQHAVKSVNGKTGEVVIDVSDIPGLVSSSLALGQNASARDFAVALGQNTSAAGIESVAIGTAASARDFAVAIGRIASAEDFGVALGKGASAQNSNEGVLGGADDFATSKWKVPGSFTVSGTKNFEIPHPKPEKSATHVIRHGAVESPTPGDTLYRWKVQATKDNDLVTIDLPDYFVWLNTNVQIFVTPQGHFGNGYGTLNRETEQLEIHCQLAGEYNVLVIGTRNDDHPSVQEWYIKGVEREIGESWTGETYAFEVDEIMEVEEIKEVSA